MELSTVLESLKEQAKETLDELRELDSLLTQIGTTSDLSTKKLKALGDSAYETASKYGKAAKDYLTVVQEMYEKGYENAARMSELSMLAQSAGGIDSSTANNYLLASDAAYAFKGNVEKLTEVLDGQNNIANHTAITLETMAQATTEAADTAAQYGVAVEELSALIAVVASKTKESGDETGNALNALFANLQDTSSLPVKDVFDSVNISMTETVDGAKRLKTPIQLLGELSAAYNSLSEGDIRRADILDTIGGDSSSDALSALLSDWSSYEEMLNLYSEGMGSAARDAELSANTWEGSMTRLSNTWTDTIGNIANSDAIVTGINALNGLLEIVNRLTGAIGPLASLGLGAGFYSINAFIKNFA